MHSVQLGTYDFLSGVKSNDLEILANMPLGGQVHDASGGLYNKFQYVRLADMPERVSVENGGRDITFIVNNEFLSEVRARGNASAKVGEYTFTMLKYPDSRAR